MASETERVEYVFEGDIKSLRTATQTAMNLLNKYSDTMRRTSSTEGFRASKKSTQSMNASINKLTKDVDKMQAKLKSVGDVKLPSGSSAAKAMGSTMQIMLIILGLRFILVPIKTTKAQMNAVSKKEMLIKSILGGIVVGFICGFVGAGGGMMLLFVLTSLLGYQMHMAVGTSVFIMAFTALTGGISHIAFGGIPDFTVLMFCCLFTLLWAQIASKIANKVDTRTLNIVVGIVLILTGIVVLVFNNL